MNSSHASSIDKRWLSGSFRNAANAFKRGINNQQLIDRVRLHQRRDRGGQLAADNRFDCIAREDCVGFNHRALWNTAHLAVVGQVHIGPQRCQAEQRGHLAHVFLARVFEFDRLGAAQLALE